MMIRKALKSILLYGFTFLVAVQVASAGGVNVVGGLTREAALKPGGKTEGTILLQNISEEPQEVRVYQSDYLRFADGTSVYGDPGSVARSNSSWITFTPRQITIPAGETASVYYTVQAPEDEKLVGTYWSLLMVEPLAKGRLEPSKQEKGKISLGIQTVMRYAVQIISNIGDTGKVEMKFTNRQLLVQGDQRVLQVDIENTGERALVPLLWTEIYNPEGASLGRFEGRRLRLYPGCSGRFRVDLSQLSRGNYDALVVADNHDEYVFGTQCKLVIP